MSDNNSYIIMFVQQVELAENRGVGMANLPFPQFVVGWSWETSGNHWEVSHNFLPHIQEKSGVSLHRGIGEKDIS